MTVSLRTRFSLALAALTVALASGLMALALEARPAYACSIVTPHEARFGEWVERSPIVAIGHWEAVSEREVTFVVEQPLKGTEVGGRLPVDNRTTYTAVSCSPYDEPFREGHRFVPGERAVLLLEKQVDGLWQVAHLALAVFEVPGSLDAPLEGMGWYFGDAEAGTPTDIRLSTIVDASGYEGAVSLEPGPAGPAGGHISGGPGWSPFPGRAVAGLEARPDRGPGWPALAIGMVLFGAPIAWRWRQNAPTARM